MAVVPDEWALRALRVVLLLLSPNDTVCDCFLNVLGSHVKRNVKALQLGDSSYSLRSWRRGKATCDCIQHGNVDRTLLKGRWSNVKVARDYVAEAIAAVYDRCRHVTASPFSCEA